MPEAMSESLRILSPSLAAPNRKRPSARGVAGCGGFTLLELLTALAIFAFVAMMAYGGLRTVLNGERDIRERAERLATLQRAWGMLGRDLTQVVDRSIRDEFGTEQPGLANPAAGVLEFTRGGWRNPAGRLRSSLQRVAYRLDGETLERFAWQVLDRAQDSQPYRIKLLEGVRRLELRFLDENREWQEQWPPLSLAPGQPTVLPLALEVTIELKEWGRITRLFPLPGSAAPQPQSQP